jgi:hypothetical protein
MSGSTLPGGTHLDDLVDLLVLPLVRLGHLLPTGHHLVVSFVDTAIVVWRRVEVGVAFGAMPLVVGSGGVRLEVAGGRGGPRRGALVRVHGGSLLQVQAYQSMCWGG